VASTRRRIVDAIRGHLDLDTWLYEYAVDRDSHSEPGAPPVAFGLWARYPLRAGPIGIGTDVAAVAAQGVRGFVTDLPACATITPCWYLYVTEQAVATAQARSFLRCDVRPGGWAFMLARFAVRAPYGLGMGHPAAVQRAIDAVGLPRVLLASVGSAAGRLLARRPTGPNPPLLPDVWATLTPPTPVWTALRVSRAVRRVITGLAAETFGGTVVIDGTVVLGHDTDQPAAVLGAAFGDDPLAAARGRTPFAVVVDAGYDSNREPRSCAASAA
jgi:asparagine synthase (glutamine-hydrolysing)